MNQAVACLAILLPVLLSVPALSFSESGEVQDNLYKFDDGFYEKIQHMQNMTSHGRADSSDNATLAAHSVRGRKAIIRGRKASFRRSRRNIRGHGRSLPLRRRDANLTMPSLPRKSRRRQHKSSSSNNASHIMRTRTVTDDGYEDGLEQTRMAPDIPEPVTTQLLYPPQVPQVRCAMIWAWLVVPGTEFGQQRDHMHQRQAVKKPWTFRIADVPVNERP